MDISLLSLKQSLTRFLHRYHVVLFVIVALGSLSVSILLLNTIITKSGDSNGYVSSSNNASFDKETIEKVNQLRAQGETATSSIPTSGRINPFSE